MGLVIVEGMDTQMIRQQLDALRAEGVTDLEMLQELHVVSAAEFLQQLRAIKPSMTIHAIYQRVKRGRLTAVSAHGVLWIDPASGQEWLDWLRRNDDNKNYS